MSSIQRGDRTSAVTFLVEHYWPGVTAETFEAAAEQVRAKATELAAAGVGVRFLHSTLVPEDEAGYCVFEAESQSAVELAYSRAGVGFERINQALQVGLAGTPDIDAAVRAHREQAARPHRTKDDAQ